FGDVPLYRMAAVGQAGVVGNLDIQAGAGVELQNQRAFLLVEHQIHADITQPGQFVAGGGQAHETVPVRQLHAIDRVGGVGVLGDLVVQPGALEGDAGGQVYPNADGTLMQVGLAAGLPGRQTQHGHHGIAHQYDDADIRHALVADALEDRIGLDPVFDQ